MPVESSKPRVTVLTTAYNAQRYIAETVQAVRAQTFTDWEHVILDDGSTDKTPAILQRLARTEARIRLFCEPKTGRVKLLNRGLQEACGQFVAVCDADDVFLPRRLERQVAFLGDHPEVVLVGSWALVVDADGLPIQTNQFPMEHEAIVEDLLMARGPGMRASSMLYRREDLLALGGYREEYEFIEDTDILLRLSERGRLANLAEVLIKYRRHAKSVVRTKGALQGQRGLRLFEEFCTRRGQTVPPAVTEQLQTRHQGSSLINEYKKVFYLASQAGHRRTARKYAWAILRRQPFVRRHWWHVLESILGPQRAQRLLRRKRGAAAQ